MIHGSCLCGAVRWELDGTPSSMLNCHCSMCRKHHGSAFATFAIGPIASFRWVAGEDEIAVFASSEQGRRYFCRTCGAKVPGLMPEAGVAFMAAGTLEGGLGLRPQMHVFAASKAPWHAITDGLPQHAEYPPEFGMPPVERVAPPLRPGVFAGSCLCAEVAYEITRPPLRMYNCHCSRCRRARSSAHATNVFYPLDAFRWLRGEELLTEFRLPGARHFATSFCRRCGSMMPRISRARDVAVVPAGSLDSEPGMAPMAHIYVDSKADWFEITDELPRFAAAPG